MSEISETSAPGWDAISDALRDLYSGAEPLADFAPVHPYALGGPDPLDGVRIYGCHEPRPHWHMVSCGLSELYGKETDDPEVSGWGIEFSIRVARGSADDVPPKWAAALLQQLAKYVISQRPFAPGHTIHVAPGTFNDSPAQEEATPTLLAALAFALDPELGVIDTVNGTVAFLQVAALTEAEYAGAQGGNAPAALERVERDVPLHIVDRDRPSML